MKITESQIEEFAIELLEKQGFQYIYGPDITLDNQSPLPLGEAGVRGFARQSYEDVLLIDRIRNAAGIINPGIKEEHREDAVKQILRLNSPELIVNNETFHRMLYSVLGDLYKKKYNN